MWCIGPKELPISHGFVFDPTNKTNSNISKSYFGLWLDEGSKISCLYCVISKSSPHQEIAYLWVPLELPKKQKFPHTTEIAHSFPSSRSLLNITEPFFKSYTLESWWTKQRKINHSGCFKSKEIWIYNHCWYHCCFGEKSKFISRHLFFLVNKDRRKQIFRGEGLIFHSAFH